MLIRRKQGMVVQDKGGLHTDLILWELQFVGSFLIYDSSSSLCVLKACTHTVVAGKALVPRLGKTRRSKSSSANSKKYWHSWSLGELTEFGDLPTNKDMVVWGISALQWSTLLYQNMLKVLFNVPRKAWGGGEGRTTMTMKRIIWIKYI